MKITIEINPAPCEGCENKATHLIIFRDGMERVTFGYFCEACGTKVYEKDQEFIERIIPIRDEQIWICNKCRDVTSQKEMEHLIKINHALDPFCPSCGSDEIELA